MYEPDTVAQTDGQTDEQGDPYVPLHTFFRGYNTILIKKPPKNLQYH